MDERLKKYPASKCGRFTVVDTVPTKHPYCITEKHVVHAADNFGGMLSKAAIASLEDRHGRGMCGIKGCAMRQEEHTTALVVNVKSTKTLQELWTDGLQEYCLSIKDKVESDGFAGIAFTNNDK